MADTEELGWSLDVIEGWEIEDLEDAAVFSHPEGAGVLQIIGYQEDEPITDEQLTMLAQDQLDAGLTAEQVVCGEFRGLRFVQREDGDFWRTWYLRADKVALAITYSCEDEDRNEELEAVDSMLASLVLERE
ncbi:hypothetical protein [Isoalcanivorax beigongshangi]|uniref:DUF3805 domain-containing protein n=1 Tax=Isoalcanivorax beigongshangi TaxID=3238810 RepID=A0ABV4AG02_9GAMM